MLSVVHFHYLIGSAAIDILILLTISVGIAAEMHRNHPRSKDGATK
jgi:hypothetical protein